MTSRPKILVTSAAGKTGLPTTLQLLEKGYPVRAFVRRRDHRSEALKRSGAEIFVGNQYAVTDMRAAMAGVRRAYHCAPTAPNGLHFSAVFCAAAAEVVGFEHVVSLGQWLSSADHPSLFTREVYLSDLLLRMRPEMTVTTVNPGWFADNYLMVLDMAAQLGVLAMPLGDGSVQKNAPPSNGDIASVTVGALIDPDKHAGRTYRPTGPALMSPDDIATAIGDALGRRVTYRDISERMFLKALKAVPPPNFSEAAVTQLRIYAEEYRRGAFAVNAPTDVVLTVGGRPPERFEDIVRRAVASRPETRPSLARGMKALGSFLKILATRAPDTAAIEAEKDYVQLGRPLYVGDDSEWRRDHEPTVTSTALRKAA
ncbi:MAG: NmrA family NAD(P)-binding protein [Hyphomicrobiales bacterium]|nr:NmrA family NAD(P)-binding protein [Hyphomicrobiales bacterium]